MDNSVFGKGMFIVFLGGLKMTKVSIRHESKNVAGFRTFYQVLLRNHSHPPLISTWAREMFERFEPVTFCRNVELALVSGRELGFTQQTTFGEIRQQVRMRPRATDCLLEDGLMLVTQFHQACSLQGSGEVVLIMDTIRVSANTPSVFCVTFDQHCCALNGTISLRNRLFFKMETLFAYRLR